MTLQAMIPLLITSLLLISAWVIYVWRLRSLHDHVREVKQRLALAEDALRERNRQLHDLMITDKLTALYHRQHLDHMLGIEFEHARRYQRPLALVLFDLDHFKRINDLHGHQVGDDVLQQFARLVRPNIRKSDIFGRWGGEEFLLICPEQSVERAAEVANKIRQLLAAKVWPLGFTVTVSAGVAECGDLQSIEQVIASVDRQLYRAKSAGRNQVCYDPIGRNY